MANDKKPKLEDVGAPTFSTSDLKYILEVNQKAVEIYVEVEKQNDQILNTLEYFKEVASRIEEQIDSVKRAATTAEELLKYDNSHNQAIMVELLKTLNENINTVSEEIKELKTSVSNNKASTDTIIKQLDTEIKSKISEIDKNLFRLVIILGSAGVGTIFTILQTFLPHK